MSFIVQRGPYLTLYYTGSNDPSGTDAPTRPGNPHPDRLPESSCAGYSTSEARVFQGNCFCYGWPKAIGKFGNPGVGIVTGPGTVLSNAGLSKNFALTEQAMLRFESTFTNLPNHVNLSPPPMRVNSGSFGVISSVQNPEGAAHPKGSPRAATGLLIPVSGAGMGLPHNFPRFSRNK